MGSFCEYQQEFDWLSNQVQEWTQNDVVETFVGRSNPR